MHGPTGDGPLSQTAVPPSGPQGIAPDSNETRGRAFRRTRITSSATTVKKIPKCHQIELISGIESTLEAYLTNNIDGEELALVVWILTRVTPHTKLTDIRCGTYDDLLYKYKVAAERERKSSPSTYGVNVNKLRTFLAERSDDTSEKIVELALELGFRGQWLDPKKMVKKKMCDRIKDLQAQSNDTTKHHSTAAESLEASKKRRLAEMEIRATATADLPATQGQLTLPMLAARAQERAAKAAAAAAAAAAPVAVQPVTAVEPGPQQQEPAPAQPGPLQLEAHGPVLQPEPPLPAATQNQPAQAQPDSTEHSEPVTVQPEPETQPAPEQQPEPVQAGPVQAGPGELNEELSLATCKVCKKPAPFTCSERPGVDDCQCPRCFFCLDVIVKEEKDSEVLECGHLLHTTCLNRWVSTSGKPKAAACPLKCYQNLDTAAAETSLLASAAGA